MRSDRLLVWLAVFLSTVLSGSLGAESEKSGNTHEPPVNPDPHHLVWINPGRFTMGRPTNHLNRENTEGPQTQVTISRGFWMSKHQTTQAEYESVMGTNPSDFKGDTNGPVYRVRWIDATNYCARLTARNRAADRLPAGYVYRLPTEAEWEYAARAGTSTWSNAENDVGHKKFGAYGWLSSTSGMPTHPAAAKYFNQWGLYDMGGDVWEWCQDWYKDSLPGGSVMDPVGPASGSRRVIRSGRWPRRLGLPGDGPYSWSPGFRNGIVGFRPVLASGQ